MTSLSGSLTSTNSLSRASPVTASDHLTADSLTLSHPIRRHSFSTYNSSTLTHRSFDQSFTKLPAARPTAYSSSEDEAEEQQVQSPEKRNTTTRKEQEVKKYKSAEFVDNESDDSDGDTSDHQQLSRKQFSRSSKQTPQTENSKTLATSGKMVRMNSLTWGASVTRPSRDTKKRPLPPASPTTTKRSKLGPFLIDSGSGTDGDSDNDDGFNSDAHMTATPKLLRRGARSETQSPHDTDDGIIPSRGSLQRQGSDSIPGNQISTSKATTTSQSGRVLNVDRLRILMAKKQGGSVAQSSTLSTSLSTGRTRVDLRTRPTNGALTDDSLQKKPTVAAADDDAFASVASRRNTTYLAQKGMSQHNVHSPTPRTTPSGFRSRPVQTARDRTSNTSPRLAGQPLNEVNESSHAHRSHIQKPSTSNVAIQARKQQNPAPCASNSSVPRKANTIRSRNGSNSSFLRDILDTTKEEHRSAAKEQDNIGSELRKAQAERVSAKSSKIVHRPEVGARYGHTLRGRKTNGLEKEPASTGSAHTVAAAKDIHVPVSKSQHLAPESPSASLNNQVQESTSSAFNATTPVDRACAINLRRPNPKARPNSTTISANQTSLPAVSRKGTESTLHAIIEQSDDAASLKSADERKQRQLSLNSTSTTSSSRIKAAGQEVIVSSQSKSIASHNTRPRGSTGLSSKDVFHPKKVQPDDASQATHPSSCSPSIKNRLQQNAFRSAPESVDTIWGSLTDATELGGSMPQGASTAATTKSGHVQDPATAIISAQGTGPDATEATDFCHEIPTAHTSSSSGLRSVSVECGVRTKIPVAVMVRPERGWDVQFLARGDASDAQSAVTGELDTGPDHTTTLADATECLQPSTGKHSARDDALSATTAYLAPTRYSVEATSGVSDPMDLSVDCSTTPVSKEVAQGALSVLRDDVVLGQQPTKTSNLVGSAPLKSSGSVREDSTPSTPSPLRVFQPHSTPSEPPNPSQLNATATATVTSPKATTEPSSPHTYPSSNTSKDPIVTPLVSSISIAVVESSNLISPAEIVLPSPSISPTAEPYFEYTIHQSLSFSTSSTMTTEISTQPFTTLDNANAQIENLFKAAKQQHETLGIQNKSMTTQINDHGLSGCEATFTSTEDPNKTFTLALWVERAEVGRYANHTPPANSSPPCISRTVYALRLWKLIDAPSNEHSESDFESEDEDDDDDIERAGRIQMRIHHPLPNICTEIHTSLDAANRAAKRVQIELSHEKYPKQPLQKQWQTQSLFDLNKKLDDLRKEVDDDKGGEVDASPSLFEYEEGRRKGCWRSMFNGCGLGADRFELLVSTVRLGGPRNL